MDGVSRKLTARTTPFIWFVAGLFFVWGLVSILSQYHGYFPPDFESSAFLMGRRSTFDGIYRWAFYLHLLSGPIAIILAAMLFTSGGHGKFRNIHRLFGRILVVIVVLGLVPSGIVMASQASTGPIAGWGFALLAVTTAWCTIMAVLRARNHQFDAHRKWAIRSFILLCSPLLLRFVATSLDGLGLQSDWTYQMNAWLSWSLPIVVFEIVQKWFSVSTTTPSSENKNLDST